MAAKKLIEVTALRDFSNTIFGNVRQGNRLKISPERVRVWVEQGLVEANEVVEPNIDKMNKKELDTFARDKFDIDLDMTQSVKSLRDDVNALLEVIN